MRNCTQGTKGGTLIRLIRDLRGSSGGYSGATEVYRDYRVDIRVIEGNKIPSFYPLRTVLPHAEGRTEASPCFQLLPAIGPPVAPLYSEQAAFREPKEPDTSAENI